MLDLSDTKHTVRVNRTNWHVTSDRTARLRLCSAGQNCRPGLGELVERWKEHVQELLNPNNMAEFEDSGEDSSVFPEEVVEVVRNLLSGKVPGVEETCPEIYTLSYLFNVFI